MNQNAKIFVAGHTGLVGSAIVRCLKESGYNNLVLKRSSEFDLTRQAQTESFFDKEKVEYVFVAAAKVGGILANSEMPADFIYQNLMIESNIIHSSYLSGVKKLLFLGSSCIYPKFAEQPIKEDSLLGGKLEPTNEAYAIAKIAGIKLCEYYNVQYGTNYISAMPTNLYGINDNFDLQSSHVIPAMLRRFHEAKMTEKEEITLWGTGQPKREFLFADDLANACVFLMNNYVSNEIINVGAGHDVSIMELAYLIKEIVGFQGDIVWDHSKPDGTPRKLMDVSRIARFGWKFRTNLQDGLKITYDWFAENYNENQN